MSSVFQNSVFQLERSRIFLYSTERFLWAAEQFIFLSNNKVRQKIWTGRARNLCNTYWKIIFSLLIIHTPHKAPFCVEKKTWKEEQGGVVTQGWGGSKAVGLSGLLSQMRSWQEGYTLHWDVEFSFLLKQTQFCSLHQEPHSSYSQEKRKKTHGFPLESMKIICSVSSVPWTCSIIPSFMSVSRVVPLVLPVQGDHSICLPLPLHCCTWSAKTAAGTVEKKRVWQENSIGIHGPSPNLMTFKC